MIAPTLAAVLLLVFSHFTDGILRVGLNCQFHWSDYGCSGSLAMSAYGTKGHRAVTRQCPLSGVKRTCPSAWPMSAF